MYIAGIIFALIVAIDAETVDYCASPLCRGRPHIACGNKGEYGPACPDNTFSAKIRELRDTIVKQHNYMRNRIAGGGKMGYEPAKRMATMVWSDELAYLAELNTKQCKMKADGCHNTKKFHYSGQNIGLKGYTGPVKAYSNYDLVVEIITSWFDESRYGSMSFIDDYRSVNNSVIGHFATVVIERNTHVGCGATRYEKDSFNYFLLTCNYASMNRLGKAIYVTGDPASGCKKGVNPKYVYLCSTEEKFKYV